MNRREFVTMVGLGAGMLRGAPPAAAQESPGVRVTFLSGTTYRGSVTVVNASTGASVTRELERDSLAAGCALTLLMAVGEAGLRASLDTVHGLGDSVRIYGRGNRVRVTGAAVTMQDL